MNMNILRCWAEIDMDAVCGNFRSIRAFVPKEKKLMAVIKADGYGHGSVPIAEALEGEADFYGGGAESGGNKNSDTDSRIYSA